MKRWFMLASLSALAACGDGDNVDYTPPPDPIDEDGDGFEADEDCDDFSATVNPGATEICNGKDDNCDGQIDETGGNVYYRDEDGDGFGTAETTNACDLPNGYALETDDCDDANDTVNPGIEEDLCDGLDSDCDEVVDEDAVYSDYFLDEDRDGFGVDSAETVNACQQPNGFAPNNIDCDDLVPTVYPGAPERCNGTDDDCDSNAADDEDDVVQEWFLDADGDGFGTEDDIFDGCNPEDLRYVPAEDDCDDANDAINPLAIELCDSVDNDCDRETDEETCATRWVGIERYDQGLHEVPARRDCELVFNTEGVRIPNTCPGCDFAFAVTYTYDVEESDDSSSICLNDPHYGLGGFYPGTNVTEGGFTFLYGYSQDADDGNSALMAFIAGYGWYPITSTGVFGWQRGKADFNEDTKELEYSYGFNDLGPAGPLYLYYTYYHDGEAELLLEEEE